VRPEWVKKWPNSMTDHHHKYQGLDPLIRSVSRVTAALAKVS
jgi:23S rRNA maturation-related 3'-5' exoribonuclease YhaM